jgi:hypothetical protein
MRLVLAPKTMEGIEQKNSSNREIKNWTKNTSEIMKMKNIVAQDRR